MDASLQAVGLRGGMRSFALGWIFLFGVLWPSSGSSLKVDLLLVEAADLLEIQDEPQAALAVYEKLLASSGSANEREKAMAALGKANCLLALGSHSSLIAWVYDAGPIVSMYPDIVTELDRVVKSIPQFRYRRQKEIGNQTWTYFSGTDRESPESLRVYKVEIVGDLGSRECVLTIVESHAEYVIRKELHIDYESLETKTIDVYDSRGIENFFEAEADLGGHAMDALPFIAKDCLGVSSVLKELTFTNSYGVQRGPLSAVQVIERGEDSEGIDIELGNMRLRFTSRSGDCPIEIEEGDIVYKLLAYQEGSSSEASQRFDGEGFSFSMPSDWLMHRLPGSLNRQKAYRIIDPSFRGDLSLVFNAERVLSEYDQMRSFMRHADRVASRWGETKLELANLNPFWVRVPSDVNCSMREFRYRERERVAEAQIYIAAARESWLMLTGTCYDRYPDGMEEELRSVFESLKL